MLQELANSAAIAALNRMLEREAWAREKLAPFAGRSARFDAAPFSITLNISEDGTFGAAGEEEPAVTVAVALSTLPLALADPAAAMKDVRLAGDAEFAQALAFVLQNLRPEPEEELSRFVGDIAAQRIVGLLRLSASHWRDLAERMLDNTANYFVTEDPMLVPRVEVDSFNQDVDHLRDDVARLEKRIELAARR
jgi:ubiquinone biosynthesis accessory factor UbiJ